jgi:hypothetical protein
MKRRAIIYGVVGAVLLTLVAYGVFAAGSEDSSDRSVSLSLPSEEPTGSASIDATSGALTSPAQRAHTDAESADESPMKDIRSRAAESAESEPASEGEAQQGGTAPAPDPKAVASVTTRLTVAERQACYWKLIEAEDRAVFEANSEFPMDADPPDVDSYVALMIELTEKYVKAVQDEYKVTAAEVEAIITEGIANRWPMPPLPE